MVMLSDLLSSPLPGLEGVGWIGVKYIITLGPVVAITVGFTDGRNSGQSQRELTGY
jgi:hypothetical protein